MENTPAKNVELDAMKQELRRLVKTRLKKIDWAQISIQVLKNLRAYLHTSFKGKRIAGYWPIANEIDILPFLKEWHLEGGELCLPVVQKKNQALKFYGWKPDTKMKLGLYQIPVPEEKTNPVIPDIILVPLLAFDESGHRLGKGGGYYDRTLQELRATRSIQAIGLAAEGQYLPSIPHHSPYDQSLDVIVTEKQIIPYR